MKRKILTILTIFLIATSGLSFVSAQNELDDILITESEEENNESRSIRQRETSEDSLNLAEERNTYEDRTGEEVKALESGYRNVSFDDGYNGYCVNHNLQSTSRGEKFTVENTTNIISSRYGESVGNYLKILFVDHYNYTMNPTTDLSQVIWTFTDYDYKNSNNEIIKSILESASNGRIIPDHGAVTKINNTTEAIFDFELLNSQYGRTQNFFGYKINYRTLEIIEDEILGSDPENNTTIENNTTTNNNTEETPQNNTTIENNTTTNNNTEETPQNNTTIENNTTTNNNTEETPQNNTTIENNTTTNNNTEETPQNNTTIENNTTTNNNTEETPQNNTTIENNTTTNNNTEETPQNNTTIENNTTTNNNTEETPQNNTTIENNTTTNNNTEETPQNNTTIENNTTTNNNTEETPQNNTTIENNTTTNNNTEETPQNNTTIEKQENNTIISKTNENQTPNLNKIKESDLAKYNTGNELTVIGIAILIIGFILLIKYTRD